MKRGENIGYFVGMVLQSFFLKKKQNLHYNTKKIISFCNFIFKSVLFITFIKVILKKKSLFLKGIAFVIALFRYALVNSITLEIPDKVTLVLQGP